MEDVYTTGDVVFGFTICAKVEKATNHKIFYALKVVDDVDDVVDFVDFVDLGGSLNRNHVSRILNKKMEADE